jgi:hypothetical protein
VVGVHPKRRGASKQRTLARITLTAGSATPVIEDNF